MVRMTKIIGLTPGPWKSQKGVMTSLLHDIMMSCCHVMLSPSCWTPVLSWTPPSPAEEASTLYLFFLVPIICSS
jgi:hypothetical protein